MKYLIGIFLLLAVFYCSETLLLTAPIEKTVEKADEDKEDQLMQRIDFGNSYILGQTIKSGAVYLLQRKKSDIKSMLKARENYREEILEGIFIKDGETANSEKSEPHN